MELIVDLLIVVLAIWAIVAGARRGLVEGLAAAVGSVGGVWLGVLAAPMVYAALSSLLPDLVPRTTIVLVVVIGAGVICWLICRTIAKAITKVGKAVPGSALVNRVTGGVFGAISAAIVTWLIAGLAVSSSVLPFVQAAQSSRIVAALNGIAPISTSQVFNAVDEAFAEAGLPEVFKGDEAPIVSVADPPTEATDTVVSRSRDVAKISASKLRCGVESTGSGWPLSSTEIVTNAHVVSGASSVRIALPGDRTTHAGRVVYYNPSLDLAVLRISGIKLTPFELAPSNSQSSDAVFAVGYPGGGQLTIVPGRVRSIVQAVGLDIYNDRTVSREVYSLRATIRAGDSGGPLLTANGKVAGVVFARSTTDSDTGYALTINEVRNALNAASSLNKTVSTGKCSVE